jgi:hypothetical protein
MSGPRSINMNSNVKPATAMKPLAVAPSFVPAMDHTGLKQRSGVAARAAVRPPHTDPLTTRVDETPGCRRYHGWIGANRVPLRFNLCF